MTQYGGHDMTFLLDGTATANYSIFATEAAVLHLCVIT